MNDVHASILERQTEIDRVLFQHAVNRAAECLNDLPLLGRDRRISHIAQTLVDFRRFLVPEQNALETKMNERKDSDVDIAAHLYADAMHLSHYPYLWKWDYEFYAFKAGAEWAAGGYEIPKPEYPERWNALARAYGYPRRHAGTGERG